jgi:hypothetical protein
MTKMHSIATNGIDALAFTLCRSHCPIRLNRLTQRREMSIFMSSTGNARLPFLTTALIPFFMATYYADHFTEFSSPARTILGAGLLAGTLDITAACLHYFFRTGNNPVTVLHYVASGIVGKEAFSGGWPIDLLGLALHFCIALTFAGVYFFLYPRLSLLRRNKLVSGIGYGIGVWLIMTWVVVPLSRVSPMPFQLIPALIGMSIIVVAVGLPISFLIHRHYRKTVMSSPVV